LPTSPLTPIRRLLLAWYRKNKRDLPWRRTADPYRIWLSEVMLQQTRAAAVIPYYERFLERFPTVEALAAAEEPEVLALWAGLGYYSRARNVHRAARSIHAHGAFPSTYESIRALPGVGEYTAAAVASIAFGLPQAVLDGNVVRVLSRITEEPGAIESQQTKARLRGVAARLLPRAHPGEFNQALMELGATVCLPKAPQCLLCPVAAHCAAHRSGREEQFPIRAARKSFEDVVEDFFIVMRENRILLWQRPADSRRLAGFWELPGPAELPGAARKSRLGFFRHTIVQTRYLCVAWIADVPERAPGMEWIALDQIARLPLSTTARKALAMAGSFFR